jgi:glycosyltransferase involved in cell wall biosynthesis
MISIKLSIIIPSYNESGNILRLYSMIKNVVDLPKDDYEIIWVDDGSTDNSIEILRQLNDVIVVSLIKNYGQTAALVSGFENSSGELVAFLDADCQNDPSDIPKMIRYLIDNKLDCVCGWRVNRKDSKTKKFVSVGAYFLRRSLLKDFTHDAGCTLKIVTRESFFDIKNKLVGELHRFIPTLLVSHGWWVGEIPVSHHPRYWGTTKYNFRRILKSYLDALSLAFWGKFSSRPLHLLGFIGIFSISIGILLFCLRIFLLFMGSDTFRFSLITLSTFLILFGFNFFFTGIILDLLSKIGVSNKTTIRYKRL